MANPYANYLQQQWDAEKSAQEQATAASIAEYQRQQDEAKLRAERYLQAADVQRQFAQRDAEQVLASQGKTGGLSETSLLRNQSMYDNTARGIREDLNSKINQLSDYINNERKSGNANQLSLAATYANALARLAEENAASNANPVYDDVAPPQQPTVINSSFADAVGLSGGNINALGKQSSLTNDIIANILAKNNGGVKATVPASNYYTQKYDQSGKYIAPATAKYTGALKYPTALTFKK